MPARRQFELLRLVIEHPGWSTATLAHTLGLSVDQAERGLLTLQVRGVIEPDGTGWRRRRSDIRSWCRS